MKCALIEFGCEIFTNNSGKSNVTVFLDFEVGFDKICAALLHARPWGGKKSNKT